MVDLSRYYNSSKRIREDSLEALPSGLQMLGGTQFDVRGVVRLAGQSVAPPGIASQSRFSTFE